jgi:hypothetical protein
MNHLDTIVVRQRKSLVRDLMFAAFVGLAALLGAVTVTSACEGATTHLAGR